MDKAVFAAEWPGTSPSTEAEAREIVQHWLAVFWPVIEIGGA